MRTWKLTLAYEGTAYVGWQRQLNGASIQGCLEAALAPLVGGQATVVGAGRTDAGVHALAQVASLRIDRDIEPPALVRAVNARLPVDIRLLKAEVAAKTFHARFDATAKTYRYCILHRPVASPFSRRYGWHVPAPLDHGLMAAAARLMVGEHDFAAFRAAGGSTRTTVRDVYSIEFGSPAADSGSIGDGPGGDVMTIEVRGAGFVRHMVRIMAGTLIDVGLQRRRLQDVEQALRTGDRSDAGRTAPPQGLFLVRVDY